MKSVPLADELPYRFYPPRLNPAALWLAGRIMPRMLRDQHRVEELDIGGLERLKPLLERGDGVLLAPNHPDFADCFLMFELSLRLGKPFYYMAAYQIFAGRNQWVLPRIGVFPVDREGADLTAFKTGVDVLAKGRNPLVIFPEGEIYQLSERLTPLREGAVAVATTAVKRLADAGKTVWIVPVALKYRFLDHVDPIPKLLEKMAALEARFTWWPQVHRTLVDRIYQYAEGGLGLKEHEYLGAVRPGVLKERIANLARGILDGIEDRRVGKRRDDTVPVRVKELRRVCLDVLAEAGTTREEADSARRDLHDLFVAIQCFSYPGDYVREDPTLERVAETLRKFEQDVLGGWEPTLPGPRRGILRVGEPIDVRARLAAGGKPRQVVGALTSELEGRMQALMDTIGPGRPIDPSVASARRELQSSSA